MPRVGNLTLTLYSLGAISSGIKVRILETFLLIFYNQAVGLPPGMVSIVILIGTIFDAFTDPLIGYSSDRLKTRLGRRHPLMYGSALPLAVFFFLLFTPPVGLSTSATYAWMVVCFLAVRLSYTLYENSSKALGPELVADYNRRTTLVSLRVLFRTTAGMGTAVLAYSYFLKAGPGGVGGVTDRGGYFNLAVFCATLMLVMIVVSARVTQWVIPWLSKPTVSLGNPLRAFVDMFRMLRNRAAFTILAAGMLGATTNSTRNGLELYFGIYFWGLTQDQISIMVTLSAVATVVGSALVPIMSRRFEKRELTLVIFAVAVVLNGLPILLRLLDLMPANGSPLLFAILLTDSFITFTLYVITSILNNSMLTDVTEELAVHSGQRTEGLLFSADGFFSKATNGLGIMIAGAVLTWAAFPQHAKPGQVSPDALWSLGAIFLPIVLVLNAATFWATWNFRIDRKRHEANLRSLSETMIAEGAAMDRIERGGTALD
jgi:Na+/melibiose symporter-like transporter